MDTQQMAETNYEAGDVVEVCRPNDYVPRFIRVVKVDKAFGVVYFNNPQGSLGTTETIGFAGISKIRKKIFR